MLDLSNNNGPVDFKRLFQAGQKRVYLKLTEGVTFNDPTFAGLRKRARAAGLKVGAYHFARGIPAGNSAKDEADHFLSQLPSLSSGDLRPALDLEFEQPSADVGNWAKEWLSLVRSKTGVAPIIYSYGSFLEGCRFSTPPAALWLASYGRNDGKEYPFTIPSPWKGVAAHQFSSNGRVPGCSGPVDVSHIFVANAIDVPPGV
jgi:GH25 family lysozyme M1 (1,4-beta-N-acetylmuramidase)